ISQMSCGMGMWMNDCVVRIAGRLNVPDQVNEPVVVVRSILIASASPGAHDHMINGASSPRGHTVLSYGYRYARPSALPSDVGASSAAKVPASVTAEPRPSPPTPPTPPPEVS